MLFCLTPLYCMTRSNVASNAGMGIPPHLVELLRNIYGQQRTAVRTVNLLSEWFQIKKGVREGINLSSCLFKIVTEQVMRRAPLGLEGFRIGWKTISNQVCWWHCTSGHITKWTTRLSKSCQVGWKGIQYDHKCSKTKVVANTSRTLEVLVDGVKPEQVIRSYTWQQNNNWWIFY